MTTPSPSSASPTIPAPRRVRRAPWLRAAVLLLAALLVLAPGAAGQPDDELGPDAFAFGQALAQARYFDLARKVYDRILAAPNRTDEEKDLARYGLALLGEQEALAAGARPDVPYAEVERLFSQSVAQVAEFARKNPKNEKAEEARLKVGTIRLAFVQWARELETDREEMSARGVDEKRLREDARKSVEQAIEYFGQLKPAPDNFDPSPLQSLAAYYWTISQYYRALTFPSCSEASMRAFAEAGDTLEAFCMDNDGQLLGVYAQDIYGLVFWELAKCATQAEQKKLYYSRALEWFVTCIDTPNQGPDYLRVITSGYYHIGQMALDAGNVDGRDFEREALDHLEGMLRQNPTAWRMENGLRAMVEWSKLECARGDAARAIEVAKDAAERAKAANIGFMERIAGRQLSHYVSGGCGSTAAGQDPEVLLRVAEDLFLRQQYGDAIKAYRNVIAAAPDSSEGFLAYAWRAWERIAQCYDKLGDKMGEALAYEPVHQAWINHVIPRGDKPEEDQNMIRAGDDRFRAQAAMKEVADLTKSPVYDALAKAMRDEFLQDYPDHPQGRAGEWNAAIDKWNLARDQKKEGNPGWKSTLAQARTHFENVAKDEKSERQDLAWVYLIRSWLDPMDVKPAEAVRVAQEAMAFWDDPARKALAERFDSVRARQEAARGEATFWLAQAQYDLGSPKDTAATLKGYHEHFPNIRDPYPSMAHGLLAKAAAEAGDIEEADRQFRILLQKDPEYFDLGNITVRLAEYYNQQRAKIEEDLRGVALQLHDKSPALVEARRRAIEIGSTLSDTTARLNKYLEAIRKDADAKAKGEDSPVPPGVLREAEEQKPLLEKEIADLERQRQEWVKKRDALAPEVDQLKEEQARLRLEIYDPLIKAAGYYKAWDDARKERGLERTPQNIAIFAQWFWFASTLRPEIRSNLESARELYEDYLAFPQIQKLPITDPDKQRAVGRLGDVYVNLAEAESDPEARRTLVRRAVDLLQNSIAKDPADNDLLVGMLANRFLVLQWRHPTEVRWYRFPIPRPADVAGLREEVQKLRVGQPPLPDYEDVEKKRRYERALQLFQEAISKETDATLRDLVNRAGFDPALYRELGTSDRDFLMALAWAYAESGRPEDLPKAINLALALTKGGALAADDDSLEWWRAQGILLRSYVHAAEQGLAGGVGGDAAQWLERAGQVLQGLAAIYPDLGDSVLPGNRKRLEALLRTINDLRGKAGLPAVTIVEAPTDGSGGNGGDGG